MARIVSVDLLLPGSNYLVKDIDNDELILHIKEDARRDLERQLSHNTTDHELSEFLKTPEYFRFQSIRNDGKKEIFHDEYKRYRNLGLYKPTLALVKTRKQDKKQEFALQCIRQAISSTEYLTDEIVEKTERYEKTEKISQNYISLGDCGDKQLVQHQETRILARQQVICKPVRHFHKEIFSYCSSLLDQRRRDWGEELINGVFNVCLTPNTSGETILNKPDGNNEERIETDNKVVKLAKNKPDLALLYETFKYTHAASSEMCHDRETTLIPEELLQEDDTDFQVKVFIMTDEFEKELHLNESQNADIFDTPSHLPNPDKNEVSVDSKIFVFKRKTRPLDIIRQIIDYKCQESHMNSRSSQTSRSQQWANLNMDSSFEQETETPETMTTSLAELTITQEEDLCRSFVLKILGHDEYVLDNECIGHHRYFHKCWNWHGLDHYKDRYFGLPDDPNFEKLPKNKFHAQSMPALVLRSIHSVLKELQPSERFLSTKLTTVCTDAHFSRKTPPNSVPCIQEEIALIEEQKAKQSQNFSIALEKLDCQIGLGKHLSDIVHDDTSIVEIVSLWLGEKLLAEEDFVLNSPSGKKIHRVFNTRKNRNDRGLPRYVRRSSASKHRKHVSNNIPPEQARNQAFSLFQEGKEEKDLEVDFSFKSQSHVNQFQNKTGIVIKIENCEKSGKSTFRPNPSVGMYLPTRRIIFDGLDVNDVPLGTFLRVDYVNMDSGKVIKFSNLALANEEEKSVHGWKSATHQYMPMFSPVNETIIPYFAKFYKPDEPNQPDPRSGFPMFWDIDSLDESSSSKNGKYYLTVTFNDGYGNAYRNRYKQEPKITNRPMSQTNVESSSGHGAAGFMHTYWPDYIHPSERSKIPSRNTQPTPLDRIQIDGNTKKLLSNDFIAKTLEQISRNWTFEPAIKIRFDLAKHLMNEQFTGEWDKVAGYKEYGLILLAKCINWLSQIDVLKFYSLIKAWPWESVPINAILQILDCSTPTDPVLRTYAVRKALSKRLNHEPLLNILLQLVTLVQNEPHVDNALTRWLLEKAIRSRKVAHFLYWHLVAAIETTTKSYLTLRLRLILEALLRSIGPYREQISRQAFLNTKLTEISIVLSRMPDPSGQESKLKELLSNPNTQEQFNNLTSPLSPTQHLGSLDHMSCSVKSSAKCPIQLKWRNGRSSEVFMVRKDREKRRLEKIAKQDEKDLIKMQNEVSEYNMILPEGSVLEENNFPDLEIQFQDSYSILFKLGDDLRQDMLHCQALRVMDNLWQSRSVLEDKPALVLFPMPYGCLATGKSDSGGLRGLIEIVPGSKTIRQIDGLNGPMAHLNIGHTHLFRYLTEVYDIEDYCGGLDGGGGDNSSSRNDRDDRENKISKIIASKKEQVCDIFSRSLAAACASTYIIGVKDRHMDNMMVRSNGQFFHIDFGHILNHRKRFGTKGLGGYGFVRGNEKMPFVLTKSSITVVCRGKTPTDQGLVQVKSKNLVKNSASLTGNVSMVGKGDDLSSLPSGHRGRMPASIGSPNDNESNIESYDGFLYERSDYDRQNDKQSQASLNNSERDIDGTSSVGKYDKINAANQALLELDRWKDLTLKAFVTLKKHDKFLISMFAILRKAGLPELPPQWQKDCDQGLPYLIAKLKTPDGGFIQQIEEAAATGDKIFSLNTVDRVAHAMKHRGGNDNAKEKDFDGKRSGKSKV